MSNYPSWQVTLTIIHLYWIYILEYRCTDQQDICLFYFRASSVPCLHTNCAVDTRARHTCSVSANHAGERNFWYVQADCVNNRPVKQYIVSGPFVTASQTTQNNKPKLTKRCTRVLFCCLHVLFPTYEAMTSSLHSNYSFFAEIITYSRQHHGIVSGIWLFLSNFIILLM